jgi:hypothetical protein
MYRITALPFFQSTETGMRVGSNGDILRPLGMIQVSSVSSAISAATNQQVDQWNSIVQEMNPSQLPELNSGDRLCEVDDRHGPIELHHINSSSNLDICLITRTGQSYQSQILTSLIFNPFLSKLITMSHLLRQREHD